MSVVDAVLRWALGQLEAPIALLYLSLYEQHIRTCFGVADATWVIITARGKMGHISHEVAPPPTLAVGGGVVGGGVRGGRGEVGGVGGEVGGR